MDDDLALAARTVDELVAACQAGAQPSFLHFWGHTPRGDEIGPHVLSQWFPITFTDAEGHSFSSAEHYMMWRKATLFGDTSTATAILRAATPDEAKTLGRGVTPFEDPTWAQHRWGIVVDASRLKFSSDPVLRDYLQGTRSRVLVEASPRDRIWGIGLSAGSEDAGRPSRWRGLNLLGFALMEARLLLRPPR